MFLLFFLYFCDNSKRVSEVGEDFPSVLFSPYS